jgi:hypothetical protein
VNADGVIKKWFGEILEMFGALDDGGESTGTDLVLEV